MSLGELLRQFPKGCSLDTLNRETSQRLGRDYCTRTTLRDLQMLERLGLVRNLTTRYGKWLWIETTHLAESPRLSQRITEQLRQTIFSEQGVSRGA